MVHLAAPRPQIEIPPPVRTGGRREGLQAGNLVAKPLRDVGDLSVEVVGQLRERGWLRHTVPDALSQSLQHISERLLMFEAERFDMM